MIYAILNRKSVAFIVAAAVAAAALDVSARADGGIDRGFLKDLLEIPSQTGSRAEILRAIDFTRDWLAARGAYCTIETNEAGMVGLYAATTPGKRHDYLFVSHLDVVPAPDDMYKMRVDGDRFFARGACDTKGNAVMMAQVVANLVGKSSVALFLATDEEGGGSGTGTPQMMIDRGYLPKKLVIVGDTAGEEPGQLFTAEKGHAHIDFIAHGKGGHSSRPWALDNPVPKLCAAYLKFKESWDPDADPNEHWRTVLSPTVLSASKVNNVVSDSATMHFSCRYTTMAEYRRAVAALKAAGKPYGVEVVARPGRRPVENKPDDPEIAALLKAMNGEIPGGVREGKMSAATDASYYAQLDVPIVIATADAGEPHSVREWGSFSSLDAYADFFTKYLGSPERAAP